MYVMSGDGMYKSFANEDWTILREEKDVSKSSDPLSYVKIRILKFEMAN